MASVVTWAGEPRGMPSRRPIHRAFDLKPETLQPHAGRGHSGRDSEVAHVKAMRQGPLANEVDLWMNGINRNVDGKQTRKIMRYSGGYPAYRDHCDAVAADNYRELMLD